MTKEEFEYKLASLDVVVGNNSKWMLTFFKDGYEPFDLYPYTTLDEIGTKFYAADEIYGVILKWASGECTPYSVEWGDGDKDSSIGNLVSQNSVILLYESRWRTDVGSTYIAAVMATTRDNACNIIMRHATQGELLRDRMHVYPIISGLTMFEKKWGHIKKLK